MAGNKRPLINSEPVSEFGAALPDDGGTVAPVDLLYVPGFSERRVQRDTEMVEYRDGTRLGRDVSVLPANVRWVAITRGAKDEPSSMKLMRAANNGYRPVTKDMLPGSDGRPKHAWLAGLPPGAKVLPDGTILNAAGDLQLHYCDAATAARNQARRTRAALQAVDAVGANLGNGAEGLEQVVAKTGGLVTEPTVERTTTP